MSIQHLGFSSEPQYDVTYYSDIEDVNHLEQEMVYLSEVVDNCIQYKCRAELWSISFVVKLGYVNSEGEYRLIK